jgi:para-aminobenzoate synthetase component 2
VTARILVVDNYDSFVFNLVQYLQQLGEEVEVLRNDNVNVAQAAGFDGILLSPGPGTPEDAGICVELIKALGSTTPIFGVCLGHQAIAEAYGATVSRAPELLHGKTSEIHHDGLGVFEGLPEPFTATRYHSLAVEPDTVPASLIVTARSESGVVMGLRHREHRVEGVQFHPESVLTQSGHRLLANWLVSCGEDQAVARSSDLGPLIAK